MGGTAMGEEPVEGRAGTAAAPGGTVFASVLRRVVAEGGDADTNGAVAGALLGCRVGFSGLPAAWVAELAHASWLEAHVQKLLLMAGIITDVVATCGADAP